MQAVLSQIQRKAPQRWTRDELLVLVESMLGFQSASLSTLTVRQCLEYLVKEHKTYNQPEPLGLARKVKTYAQHHNLNGKSLLFPSQKGKKTLTRTALWRALNGLFRKFKVPVKAALKVLQLRAAQTRDTALFLRQIQKAPSKPKPQTSRFEVEEYHESTYSEEGESCGEEYG